MSLRDVPFVGSIFAVGADLLVFGGDTIMLVIMATIETIDLWVPMLSYLSRLAERVDWLPADMIQTAFLAAIAVFVVYYSVRIGSQIFGVVRDNYGN